MTTTDLLDDAFEIKVTLANGDTYEVENGYVMSLINNVAILKVPAKNVSYLKLAKKMPKVKTESYSVAVSYGIKSFFSGKLTSRKRNDLVLKTVHKGSLLGGPVLDKEGKVIGIVYMEDKDPNISMLKILNLSVSLDAKILNLKICQSLKISKGMRKFWR